MVVGQLHAREMFSSELVRLWMLSMITSRTPDAGIVEWIMVPCANPCARDMVVEGYRALRSSPGSNRSIDWQVCKRTSCSGVDLNRNWATEHGMMASPDNGRMHWDRTPETKPGNEAFSEPETASLRLLLHEYSPHMLFNVHTGTVGIKAPPEDGSSWKPSNAAKMTMIKAWTEIKTNCCAGLPRVYSKISQGSMTDYAATKIMTPAPLTLEVYRRTPHGVPPVNFSASAPEYIGAERWGNDPYNCFWFYNPYPNHIIEAAAPWLRLWRALFYLNEKDQKILEDNLTE